MKALIVFNDGDSRMMERVDDSGLAMAAEPDVIEEDEEGAAAVAALKE